MRRPASELEKPEWPYATAPPWRKQRCSKPRGPPRSALAAHDSGDRTWCWLTGPRGIGKPTLAAFARFLLGGRQQGGLFSGGAAAASMSGQMRRQVAGRCAPAPIFHLRRCSNPDTGRVRAEIFVDDVRDLGGFEYMTLAMAKWRVTIVEPGYR